MDTRLIMLIAFVAAFLLLLWSLKRHVRKGHASARRGRQKKKKTLRATALRRGPGS
jgi:hypothetical protein